MAWVIKNNQSTSAVNPSITMTNALTNPSLILVFAKVPSATIATPTDTAGHTFLDAGPGTVLFKTSTSSLRLFYVLNTATTASNAVTINSAGVTMRITVVEWTGHALSSPVDKFNSAANQSSGVGGGQNMSSGATATLSTNAGLAIGFCVADAGTVTQGTGFTALAHPQAEYQILAANTAIAATANDGTNNDAYGALVVVFLPFTVTGVVTTEYLNLTQALNRSANF